ncbi:hypothetical protein J5N97_004433 [Dioscorea zingiberensis]|uniref:Tf2-1-like SH3-like domain-containing protein n=1 Tax=Dioscorea zingiberensis TaxID=325984 RepID=A0A9D5D7U9_9LILI|nr:hypothetical protein J5N97_004433 [Dioscorea zingiberensis]
MPPYEALYGRRCRTPLCWDEEGERKILGPELVQQTAEKIKLIRERLKKAQDRQRGYANNRRRFLEFEVGDRVFLKVSPWKGVFRFRKRGKLNPRYIGPYEIVDRVGPVAYRLELPEELSRIHNVFHVSVLRKCLGDQHQILSGPTVELAPDLTYVEGPVRILDRREQALRNKTIPLVKVLWNHHQVEEATWEREDQMKEQYPHLF